MATIEETFKIAANTKFAVLARALADNAPESAAHRAALEELMLQRRIEHQRRSKQEMLATLGRMIADASLQGRDRAALLADVAAVRHAEKTGEPLETLRNSLGEFAAPAQSISGSTREKLQELRQTIRGRR